MQLLPDWLASHTEGLAVKDRPVSKPKYNWPQSPVLAHHVQVSIKKYNSFKKEKKKLPTVKKQNNRIRLKFKINLINMSKDFMEKVDNMHEQMG